MLLASVAVAQSRPGITFDQTITRVTSTGAGATDSSTSEVHTTTSRSEMRVETVRNSLFENIGPFSPGPHAVLLTRDGGREMVFMNPDKKEYMSMRPLDMVEGARKMIEGMGGSMTFDTAASRVTFDSVGSGPTIDGHPTVRYRITMAVKMRLSMMGQESVVDDRSTQELDVATDMEDFTAAASAMNGFAEMFQSMGFGKDIFEKLAASRRKMRGVPIRIVKNSTKLEHGIVRTSTETIETRNVKRVTVPDSLFAIPADYKSISMPAMPGTG